MTVEDLVPLMLYLPEADFAERMELGRQHFRENGLKVHEVWGIHSTNFGIAGTLPYTLDDPNRTIPQGQKDIGSVLSHYIIYNVINAMQGEYFFILEDDARFIDGWKEKLNQALQDVPQDFDVLFVGSCCTCNLRPQHIKGMVFGGIYPMCGHAYIVHKRCMGLFLSTQRTTAIPTDIQLKQKAFPHLKVFTILPRLAGQQQYNNMPELEI
jgi:GR25 family glycosyltransferase involved in LPS biosynthesis